MPSKLSRYRLANTSDSGLLTPTDLDDLPGSERKAAERVKELLRKGFAKSTIIQKVKKNSSHVKVIQAINDTQPERLIRSVEDFVEDIINLESMK